MFLLRLCLASQSPLIAEEFLIAHSFTTLLKFLIAPLSSQVYVRNSITINDMRYFIFAVFSILFFVSCAVRREVHSIGTTKIVTVDTTVINHTLSTTYPKD